MIEIQVLMGELVILEGLAKDDNLTLEQVQDDMVSWVERSGLNVFSEIVVRARFTDPQVMEQIMKGRRNAE